MSEELQSKYLKKGKIIGQQIGEFEYFQIGTSTFKQLKQAKIIPTKYNKKHDSKKPDRLLVDRRNKANPVVIAVIEDKQSGKFLNESEKRKAIEQCNNYAQELGAKMGIITDGSITVWINPNEKNKDTEYLDETTQKKRSFSFIKKEDGAEVILNFYIQEKEDISDVERVGDETKMLLKTILEINRKINKKNSTIKQPGRIDPLPLARRVWQDIWVATGKTPEKCLYNVVELFIFKFLSDLDILEENFDELYRRIERGDAAKKILDFYVDRCRKEIRDKFETGDDGTTIINGTIFVDESGKANLTQANLFKESIQKFKEFEKEFGKFSTHNIDKDFKTKLYESFLKQTAGLKALGQFFTPRKVIRSIVDMSGVANFKGGERICDPFCGVGGFVLEPLNLDERKNDFKPKNGKIDSPIMYKGYEKGFEKDEERTIILAKANMLIHLAELIADNKTIPQEFAKNAFNKTFTLWRTNLGTLGEINDSFQEKTKFDLILTNPPYVKRGIKTLKNEIEENADLKKFYEAGGGGLEGLALEWIIKHLKKGGKAFVVIPDGILNRLDDKSLRKYILQECYLDGIISLPQKTFYATPKKTYILAITKKSSTSEIQGFPVFTYLINDIGETLDINRFEIPEKNDLPEMIDLFSEYQLYKNKSKVNELEIKSPLCKIQDINKFDPNKHWSVDRWWTREEKIELGIEEEELEISPSEFYELIEDSHKEIGTILEQSRELLKKKPKKQLNHKLRAICLADIEYFNLSIGKRLLKKDLFGKDLGDRALIPAYSANVFIPFGFVEKSNILNFENPYVLWGIDGNFEFNFKDKGEAFASTDHCGTIEVLDKNIDPQYLLLSLELKRHEYGFDRGLRSSLANVSKIKIDFPIKNDGGIDLDKQRAVVKDSKEISKIKDKILTIKKQITESEINFSENFEYKEEELLSLFDIKQGNAYYTKKRIIGSGWSGNLPVYSSNTKNEGLLMKMDIKKVKEDDLYYQYCLTWSVDGYAGTLFIRNEKNKENHKKEKFYFTFNNHCGILLPKFINLYLPFIKYLLQPIFYKKSKGYGNNKVGTNQIKDIIVKLPINKAGDFDLEKQKEIAFRYEKVDELKKELTDKLDTLTKHSISQIE
ncbi:MAG: N-6 DNA methylase [Parcubacteria group bacterium]|nr:N-6 DNA methylase [Parcubacteria group bacterium]